MSEEIPESQALEAVEKLCKKELNLGNASIKSTELGSSNHTFIINQLYVIKIEKKPNWKDNMQNEAAVLRILEDEQVKTPKLIDSGVYRDLYYKVTGLVEGETIDKYSSGRNFYELEKEEKEDIANRIGKALAKIHNSSSFERCGKLDTRDTEINQISAKTWSEGVLDIQNWWLNKLREKGFSDEAEILDRIFRSYSGKLDQVEEYKLLHMEFDLRNLLIQKNDIAVVDWETAAVGDPLLDIVMTEKRLIWREKQPDTIKKRFREGYRSKAAIKNDKLLEKIYEMFQLSRLLLIHSEDKEMTDRIKKRFKEIKEKL